jgi:drug/metabolite transporter (DMT)-like permease
LSASRSRSIGLLCLLATSVGWGLNWPVIKFLLTQWPPLFARGSAGIAAAIVLAGIALGRGERLTVPRQTIGPLLVAAFINVFAWMGFSSLALRWLAAGQAALLVYTMPLWATLLAWPLLGQRPSWRSMAGLTLCLGGLLVLFGGAGLAFGADKLPGVLFALAAAFLFALGTVKLGPLPLPPLTAVVWQLVLGCTPMLVLGLLFEHPRWNALTPLGWGLMAYVTAVPMAVCYLTWFAALRRLPPATASIATLLTPLIGVVAAALALGEPLGAKEALAMSLTISGLALVLRKR